MKPSQMKQIHENKWNPRRRSTYDDPQFSFFESRDDLTVHQVYKVDDSTYYFVYTFDGVATNPRFYRVGRFNKTGKISVLGYGTTATKFHENNGIPLPSDIEESVEMKRQNGYTPWLRGTKVYG